MNLKGTGLPPPKKLSAADLFDDFTQNDYIGCDYRDF
jgi:hypothetical protein